VNPIPDITLAEIIDITLVAVVIYAGIVWAQRTRAAFVARGILILAGVYILARQFELQMTAWIFQGFFAIFLIMIVVIFQEELRQLFERIALWSVKAPGGETMHSTIGDIVVRAMADFARDRTGALVVLRGNDPLARHIMGGIELNGRLSEPLLKSIFDPHSPGHDGAVLIEDGKVTRFAAHLPLSKDFEQLSHLGTRHSAALGLAELTDALCIVASEEKGQISLARDGRLWRIDNLGDFGAAIQDFVRDKYPTAERKKLSVGAFKENWLTKLAALAVSVGFWYVFVPGAKTVEVTYSVPVVVENLPPNLQLEQIQPSEVTATLAGPRHAFYLFDAKNLKVTVDASLAELGRRTFQITEHNLRHPKALTLQEIEPTTLRISVRKSSRDNEERS
jgi:uncharacterized protein (TIGR00159 family)